MLSRVADSLYWMSRYLERAEHTARLIDVDLQLRLDQSPEAGAGRWLRLLEASQVAPPEDGKIDAESLTHVLTLDRTNPSSIFSCVAAARENLRQVCCSLALAQNHFRHPGAQRAMVVNFCKAKIFEWQVAQTLHRVVRREFAAANLIEQFADGFGVHEGLSSRHQQSARRGPE